MGKNIVLCSDGTGNRWGVGNQTNVSKLYQRVDTDHVGDGNTVRQIRFYDNGVGTSANKYVKGVTGAFGFGLKRNVLDLYEFLARHWQDGDNIYVFGFSRGAATARAFAGMLQECGLIWSKGDFPNCKCCDEKRFQELLALAMDAYSHRKADVPASNSKQLEKLRSSVKASHAFQLADEVPMKMVGVWDTVPALGFPKGPIGLRPLFWTLEKAADFFFPHTFYNYDLDGRVENLCHALAIDDERRAFRPRVWNESATPRPRNIEQVWFAGMHSDVGGGYGRSGLASNALEWMMGHARNHGLRFRQTGHDQAHEDANPHGKMHNSRDGGAIFYRYTPRDLVKLCETGTTRWDAAGSPHEADEKVAAGQVKLHRSVLDRLQEGTARYAPGLLPQSFVVVDNPKPISDAETNGSNPSAGSAAATDDSPQDSTKPTPSGDGTAEDGAQLSVEVPRKVWQAHRHKVLRYTGLRSLLYHLFLYITLALVVWMAVLWKLSPPPEPAERTFSYAGNWIQDFPEHAAHFTHGLLTQVAALADWVLPKATEGLVQVVFVDQPMWLVVLLALAAILFALRTRWFAGRDDAAQEARRAILEDWSTKQGRKFIQEPVQGEASTVSRRFLKVLLQVLLLLFLVTLTVGAWRLSEGWPRSPGAQAEEGQAQPAGER